MSKGRSWSKERRDGDPGVDIRKEGSFTCEKERPLDVEDEDLLGEEFGENDGRSTLRLDRIGLAEGEGTDI